MAKSEQRIIQVFASWLSLKEPVLMGVLHATPSRGKEIFSFEYDGEWLQSPHAQILDPSLGLFKGPQYPPERQQNFGLFLDSSPDRWGRVLMDRREALFARTEHRKPYTLMESDYLLGVYDGHRMGAVRFRTEPDGPFLDDNESLASPPWAKLRELEHASLELEKEDAERNPHYAKWINLLIAPGASLGGARPKASVIDEKGNLWIAKFPSRKDDFDTGAWEVLLHMLANKAGIQTSECQSRKFGSRYHTFLTKRFDRLGIDRRIHFASAMTLLQRADGDTASYLEMAKFITQRGAQVGRDLEELWRRVVFFICVSNVDDHLRNHGFLLQPKGWTLSPVYDLNPVPTAGGLKLNISETDNSQSLDLTREVAPYFRVKSNRAELIINEVTKVVRSWRTYAKSIGIPAREQGLMERAFRVADK